MPVRRREALSAEHEELLETFLAEEAARGRRPRGVKRLRERVPHYLRFLEERGLRGWEASLADAYAYQGKLMERVDRKELTVGTVVSIMATASMFCAYLVRAGRILDNPFRNVRRARVEKRIPEGILNERDMDKLLSTLKTWGGERNTWQGRRRYLAHVIAEVQYASGLRISEVADMTLADVDIERALIHVRDGKQGSNRMAFLTDYACDVLEVYVGRIRPLLMTGLNGHNENRLFLSRHERLTIFMNEELKKACDEAGVTRITSHGFRHGLGYHLLRAGCPLRYIQAILGHKHISETERYTKVDVESMKAVFDECHPRMHG